MSRPIDVDALVDGLAAGDRASLGRAITLVESRASRHRAAANALLTRVMAQTGRAHRVGITGVPGVGKSTFIEALGMRLLERGRRVAVLAVDPSSSRSGGSILGDKTRMEQLARAEGAFIRPSPSAGTLGGVASRSREAMLLCEAAGYDVVLVETVGVGQSELAVARMTDFFLVLMLAGAGDELQGIKRGLMELADALVVNKADGDNVRPAKRAASTYRSALRLLRGHAEVWQPKVATCSALSGDGIDEAWALVEAHRAALEAAGEWTSRRRRQELDWMWSMVGDGLRRIFDEDAAVQGLLDATREAVLAGTLPATVAATQLLDAFKAPVEPG